jgi:hypothetical protein
MYGDRVRFIGVDILDQRASARDFMSEFGWTYPSVYDPSGAIRDGLGLLGQPVTLFYDESGRAVDTRGRVRSRRKRSTPTSHLEDARFCVERGPLLADHCESCGFELRHAARLCPACGTRVPPAAAPSEERKLVTSAVR